MDDRISNEAWTRASTIAHFGDESPRSELYRMLEGVQKDRFINSGYSRRGQRHWSVKSQIRLADRLASRLFRNGPKPRTLVDIGCGRGGPALRATQRWEADSLGIDLSPYAVEQAITMTRKEAVLNGLRFKQGDGLNIPSPDNQFNYAWAIESIAYMPDRHLFFSEISRVLCSGGRFAAATITLNEYVAQDSRFANDCLRRYLSVWDMPHIESADSYRSHMRRAGLLVAHEETATAHTLVRHSIRLRRLIRLWDNERLYAATRWYIRKKAHADLDLIRDQIEATCEAVESGVLGYHLFWAEKPGD